MSPQLFPRVLSADGVVNIVRISLRMAIETERNTVVESILATVLELRNVMKLHLGSTEPVANTTRTLAGQQRTLCHAGRESIHNARRSPEASDRPAPVSQRLTAARLLPPARFGANTALRG